MLAQLLVRVIEVSMNGGLLDGPVHPFDLSIRPWMLGLGQLVIDIADGTGVLKGMAPENPAFCECLLDVGRGPALALGIGELYAIVGKNRVDLLGHGFDEIKQELLGR